MPKGENGMSYRITVKNKKMETKICFYYSGDDWVRVDDSDTEILIQKVPEMFKDD